MTIFVPSIFLRQLKSLYPFPLQTPHRLHPGTLLVLDYLSGTLKAVTWPQVLDNPWYIVASVAFSASNRPDGVTSIYEFVSADLNVNNCTHEDHVLLVKKLRDALFKAGLTSGYPKAINSLAALNEAIPKAVRDSISTTTLRDTSVSLKDLSSHGRETFEKIYGETSQPVQNLLDSIYPDLGWFSQTIGYGLVYGYHSVLSPIETSYVLVTSIIAADTPKQINWHLAGARRQGATVAEVRAVRQIAMEAAAFSGTTWRDGVPEVALDISEQS